MKLVVKVGGQAAEEKSIRRRLARQVATLRGAGQDVVLVHGGGKLLTQTLARLGIRTEFKEGLRVTDAATRDVALMVLAGIANKQWVAEIEARGQRAVGICGGDAGLVRARKMQLGGRGTRADLGYVGQAQEVNTSVLETAFEHSWVPVVASLALGPRGEYYNLNADDLAAALAEALRADRLLYLTESGGVWDSAKKRLPLVRVNEIPRLIHDGVVRDGMIPKLRACARTLARNVSEIDILSPTVPDGLLRTVNSRQRVGTRIVRAG